MRNAYTKQERNGYKDDAPSKTHQSFTDSCNINTILDKYQRTGIMDHVKAHGEQYGEMDGTTFTEAMMQITRAQNMFNELPSRAREKFANDPARFLDYVERLDVTDPVALQELYDLGLTETAPPPQNAPQGDTEPPAPNPPPADSDPVTG